MFENKKIFILGMARSGYEAAKILASYGNKIFITDCNEQNNDHVKELEALGVTVMISDHPEDYLDESYDYVVKNPGIRYNHVVVNKAKELKIPVTNEVEVAYSYLPKNVRIIAITGSNGKTTTTTLIYKMLKAANLPVHIGGNIGFPLCSIVKDVNEGDILVLEISGHQQHDFIHFKSNITVMTNLSEVHLDFFGTYDNYKYNKSHILRNLGANDLAILNLENEDVLEVSKDCKSRKLYFSSNKNADGCIESQNLLYKKECVVSTSKIKVQGIHNYENILASILTVKEFGVSNEVIQSVLGEFGGVEHRIEYVRLLDGVEYYNDSKSTNCKSTQIALNTFKKPTLLLLGGFDRGHSFDELEPFMGFVKLILCYGETKERILKFANKIHKDCMVVDTLEEAILASHEHAKDGDVVLLSPACASLDQYKSFEERGDEFKRVVNGL